MRVSDIAERLQSVAMSLISLSRLYALRLLADRDRHAKLDASKRSAISVDLGVLLQDFATRHYQTRPALVAWPSGLHPGHARTLSRGAVDTGLLLNQIRGLTRQILSTLADLEAATATMLMAAPVRPVIEQIRASLPGVDEDLTNILPPLAQGGLVPKGPCKVLTGPEHVCTDPIFTPAYSLLEEAVPVFGESFAETVSYLWTVGVGESMAAELCALSSVEYDGMPAAFYRDMGKQAWDEMRHAVGYVEVALAMLPALEAELDANAPLRSTIQAFWRDGRGLPIPRELNLYETIHNCSLEERLILFQIQTEAPGASRKKRNLRSDLCRRFPDLGTVLEYDLRDEISHARIGRTWLAHLIPDQVARKEAIANASLLRSVFLMTSFAHHGGGSLGTLLDRYLDAPVRT